MKHNILYTAKQLDEFAEYINNNDFKLVSFDLETNSPEEIVAEVWGVGLAFEPDVAYYIPFRDKEKNLYFDENQLVGWLNEILTNFGLLGHNLVYDCSVWKHRYNVDLSSHIHCDTILLKHTIDEERPHALKEVSVKYLGEWADLAQQELYDNIKANGGSTTKTNMEMWKADTEILGKYCAHDVMLTYQLFNKLSPRLEEEGLFKLFYEDEIMPLYKEVTIPMKYRGVDVDIPHFEKLKQDISADLYDLESKILQSISDDIKELELAILQKECPVNRGRFVQVYADVIGLTLPLSKTGKVTTAAKAIEKLETSTPDQEQFRNWLLDVEGAELSTEHVITTQKQLFFLNNPDRRSIFNLHSKDQLKTLFFDIMGFTPLAETDSGEPQVDDDFLESVKQEATWIPLLQDFNKLEKIKGTYIEGVLDRVRGGKLYTSMLQFGTTSGRYSSTNPNLQNWPRPKEDDSGLSELVLKYNNEIRKGLISPEGCAFVDLDYCLHPKTELLTKRGWVGVLDLNEEDYVWQVDKDNLHGSWCKPSRLIKKDYVGNMYAFGNKRGKLHVTENHRMLWVGQFHKSRPDKERQRKVTLSQEGIKFTNYNMLFGSITDNTISNYSEREIWLACMAQADSYNYKPNNYHIQVSLPRKRAKVAELLGRSGRLYEIRKCHTLPVESWYYEFTSELITDKFLNVDLIGANQIDILVEALAFWDGSVATNKRFVWGSTNKLQAEKIQAKLVQNGFEAKLTVRYYDNPKHNTFYALHIKRKARIRFSKHDVNCYKYAGKVGCVTVDTGFILTRSDGQTFVTGNCALEPRCFSIMSDDKNLQNIFLEGEDMYSSIAKRVFNLYNVSTKKKDENFLGKLYPEKRNSVKAMALAVTYGAEAFRIADLLKVEYNEAQKIIDDYMNAYPGLKKYIENCHKEVNRYGRVKTIFGRTRHLDAAKRLYDKHGSILLDKRYAKKYNVTKERSMYKNLLNNSTNFKIQGLAAHIVNRAMINITRKFKEKGIDGQVVLQIHDQIVCVVKEQQAEEALKIVQYESENAVKLPVPLPVEPKIAHNLKESH